ncbi:3'-5' exonuclease [Streptomyces sp. NBS 14/10]|uniref:3'-5' exonuclease n=1 Tax=Streptomyces sp. NBS 14/10 TaxID=1945643 RepID=UPI000B7FD68B|nr:3'-5' exonuclease [Streptomyces sp. NBS 14/10]KAK1182867.1 3'-5' exonuclease [Streptomyces sp. NBS 14/10]NUP42401.1 3'-5' exonuclease [Streptomyces sp.]NUS90283.1 3'-5' exonuclease [Streptomyces sp.]
MGWHRELLIGFDLETTGTDPAEARIVTAAVVEVRGGEPVGRREWLADPGVTIPDDAVAVHGISTERAAAEGRPAREVADEIADVLVAHWQAGAPVVAYNAAFDLSLLAAELRRHGLPSLGERLGGAETGPVVDPYTIDRAVDRYRKGKRTLEAVCGEYGVVHERAHDAGADALAAVHVAYAVAERHGQVAGLDLWELHRRQVVWYAQWAADFQAWLRRKGTPDAVVDGHWPLHEAEDKAEAEVGAEAVAG